MNNYDHIIANFLNLKTEDIDSIRSSNENNQLRIFITLNHNVFCCPICGSVSLRSLGYYERTISLPTSLLKDSIVKLKVPRYSCKHCFHSFGDLKNISPSHHTISYYTILQVMESLKNPKMTFKSVAAMNHISETSVVRIFDKHCHIRRSHFPEAICIDEVYTKNNDFKAKYSCIFYDFYRHTIIDVAPDRKKAYLHHYFQSIKKKELDNVKYVCIDMYQPYKDISNLYFKKATICVDSFHVVKHLNDDLSKVRVRFLKQYSSHSIEYYLLKSWKNLLLNRKIDLDNKGKFNKKLNRHVNYRDLLDLILDIHPDLKNAYSLKEKYIIFNATSSIDKAEKELDELIHEFTIANIPEYEEFVGLLLNWKKEIVNSFTIYRGKRINNGVAESLNSIVSTLLFNTKGIRNHERRKKRIMYAVNKTGFTIR